MSTPEIPKTQRAAVLTTFGEDLNIKTDYPVKQPADLKPGECLIKMEFSGVCHSDLHVRDGDWTKQIPIPLVGGHEGIGRVVAIGEHSSTNVKVGDRVGVKWIANVCGRCEMCRKGAESSCIAPKKTSGFNMDGTFKEYTVSFVDYVTPIPEGLDSAAATPILCAGLTVYKALKQTNTQVGQWVAIPGAGGGLGHLAVQYAVSMGLRVIGIDTGEDKKKLALSLGAEKWVDFKESTNLIADVMKAADGLGPHAAVIAAGVGAPFNQAAMYLRPTGTLVCVGMPGDAYLHLPITLIIAKSLRIVGSSIGSQQDMSEALDICARGKVKCHNEIRNLEDVNNVMHELAQGTIVGRVVLKL